MAGGHVLFGHYKGVTFQRWLTAVSLLTGGQWPRVDDPSVAAVWSNVAVFLCSTFMSFFTLTFVFTRKGFNNYPIYKLQLAIYIIFHGRDKFVMQDILQE